MCTPSRVTMCGGATGVMFVRCGSWTRPSTVKRELVCAGVGRGSVNDRLVLDAIQVVASGRFARGDATSAMAMPSTAEYEEFAVERTGFPEVVWSPGKPASQVAASLQNLASRQRSALATHVDPLVAEAVLALLPDSEYNSLSRTIIYRSPDSASLPRPERFPGSVAVVVAGTADPGVAEECRVVAEYLGCYAFRISDVGVAGLNRLMSNVEAMRAADVLVVVTGMDGALPSIVAGLVEAPVIAVPTSVGYGASFNGLAALLSSLTSSPGVTVVNIDNGFGAAMVAARMMRMAGKLLKKREGAMARVATNRSRQ